MMAIYNWDHLTQGGSVFFMLNSSSSSSSTLSSSEFLVSKENVNNRELLHEMKSYLKTIEWDPILEEPIGIMSERLGELLYNLAHNFSCRSNFRSYTYREEMVSDAVLTCIKYAKNFNPSKSDKPNPFAYFTSIVNNAFLKRLKAEQKQQAIKIGLARPSADIFSQTITKHPKDPNNYRNYPVLESSHQGFISSFTEKEELKKESKFLYTKSEVRNKRKKGVSKTSGSSTTLFVRRRLKF